MHMVFNGKISSFFPFLSPSDWKCRTIRNTTCMLKNCAKKDIKGQQKIGDVFNKK
jgi:hypothetical protein